MRGAIQFLDAKEEMEVRELEAEMKRKLSWREIQNRRNEDVRPATMVRDVLYIKKLERRLGRELTEVEKSGEPFLTDLPNGDYRQYQIPQYRMPWDLFSGPKDVQEAEQNRSVNKLVKQEALSGGWGHTASQFKHFPFYMESNERTKEDIQP